MPRIIRSLAIAIKLAWIGFHKPDLFTQQIFVAFAQLFENALKVVEENRPYSTHLMMGDRRIVSFWMYPGLSKNPVDRITELVDEIEALKRGISCQK